MSTNPRPRLSIAHLICLIVVIWIFVLGVVVPGCGRLIGNQVLLGHDSVAHRHAFAAMQVYASDREGRFPSVDREGRPFTTSTQAFQFLIEETDIQSEGTFYVMHNPAKTAPNHDGKLEPQENGMSYVRDQNTSMPGNSPLTADEMTGPAPLVRIIPI